MSFDTHPDLVISPYSNGIKLIRPKNESASLPTIASLFAMPLMMYFVDFNTTYVDANHFIRLTNVPGNKGYYSERDFKGVPFSKYLTEETIQRLKFENDNILQTKQMTIYEDNCIRLDGLIFSSLSFKFPIFNEQDKIIGCFGISALTDTSVFKEAESLPVSLGRIIQTGLISHSKNLMPGFNIDNVYLSKQEVKCLRLLVAGKTIKLIGQHLELSPRTIEFYLENIKRKLNVKTKSELIEKVLQQIWPEILS